MSLLERMPLTSPHLPDVEQSLPAAVSLPPFEAEVSFVPIDKRSGEVAAMAVGKYGSQILLEHGYKPTDARAIVLETAVKVEELGVEAAARWDVQRKARNRGDTSFEKPSERITDPEFADPEKYVTPPETRFKLFANRNRKVIAGQRAAMVLHALGELARTDDKSVTPFDKATASIMLAKVDRDSRDLRI
jgi:hypothetical protein